MPLTRKRVTRKRSRKTVSYKRPTRKYSRAKKTTCRACATRKGTYNVYPKLRSTVRKAVKRVLRKKATNYKLSKLRGYKLRK